MTRAYRPVSDPPPIDPQRLADVRAALEGLRTGQWYRSSELYQRYRTAIVAQGREPVSVQAFGRMLTEYGCVSTKSAGTSRWMI